MGFWRTLALGAVCAVVCCGKSGDRQDAPAPSNSAKEAADSTSAEGKTEESAPVRVVIPGNCDWDIDHRELAPKSGGDVKWRLLSGRSVRTEGVGSAYLAPEDGAKLGLLEKSAWDERKGVSVDRWKLSTAQVPVESLESGKVVAVETSEGRFGLLRLVRFYGLHDFSFPGADLRSEEWRKFARGEPDVPKFNVELEWEAVTPEARGGGR